MTYTNTTVENGSRPSVPRRNGYGRYVCLACALIAALTTGATNAASTGGVGDLTAVGSNSVPVVATAVEPAAAESKKLTGKASSLMDGYMRTGSHKGDKGYNEDDAFGDKDSDSYGFGTQVSFGSKGGDGGNGAYHESSAYDDHGKSNPKYSAWHFEEKDGKPTKRYVYDSHDKKAGKRDPQTVEAEASEYDSVEAYDDGDDGGTHAGYETDEAEPEYGNLYDSADAYNDADTYY